MKKNLLSACIALLLFACAYGQDEIAEIQQEWGKDKRALVSLAMDLSDADSVKFWPLYNKYEMERQKLGRERMVILSDFADNFESLTNTKADELINKIFKNELALTKLQQQYYTSIKAKLNALKAAKFLQIENYISASIRSAIQEELPFIGELDSIKTKD